MDEPGCAIAWRIGDESLSGLGKRIEVAHGEPAVWAFDATRVSDGKETIAGAYREGDSHRLDSLWTVPDDLRYDGLAILGTAEGALVGSGVGGRESGFSVALLDVPRVGDPTPETRRLATLAIPSLVKSLDLVDGGADSRLLVGTGYDGVFLLDHVDFALTSLEASADAVITTDEIGTGLGSAVLFLPDPSGDGISDMVIGWPGWDPGYFMSGVYFFDGLFRGVATPDDADAGVEEADDVGFGESLDPVGDLDGDGVEDLAVRDGNAATHVWFGPFLEWTTTDDVPNVTVRGLAAGLAPDGDEFPDLAIVHNLDNEVGVFRGPISRGAIDWELADHTFEPDGIEVDGYMLAFADIDADGSSELVVGEQGYPRGATDDFLGAIVAYGLLGP